ncbi:hypothetical protein PENSPDRAFT_444367 [Peniophora sp. CONT]|nr:hypothetical protein PENSPDRAFT_444367 [Peniophora sp. CONT]
MVDVVDAGIYTPENVTGWMRAYRRERRVTDIGPNSVHHYISGLTEAHAHLEEFHRFRRILTVSLQVVIPNVFDRKKQPRSHARVLSISRLSRFITGRGRLEEDVCHHCAAYG